MALIVLCARKRTAFAGVPYGCLNCGRFVSLWLALGEQTGERPAQQVAGEPDDWLIRLASSARRSVSVAERRAASGEPLATLGGEQVAASATTATCCSQVINLFIVRWPDARLILLGARRRDSAASGPHLGADLAATGAHWPPRRAARSSRPALRKSLAANGMKRHCISPIALWPAPRLPAPAMLDCGAAGFVGARRSIQVAYLHAE